MRQLLRWQVAVGGPMIDPWGAAGRASLSRDMSDTFPSARAMRDSRIDDPSRSSRHADSATKKADPNRELGGSLRLQSSAQALMRASVHLRPKSYPAAL